MRYGLLLFLFKIFHKEIKFMRFINMANQYSPPPDRMISSITCMNATPLFIKNYF